jgi:hypothetical protein
MATDNLRPLTIQFLDDKPYGLRSVTQVNWSVECLISSRSALPVSLGSQLTRKALDVPGVYLLNGPPVKSDDNLHRDSRLYIGQADSVADRLDSHLSGKEWWRSVAVIRRPDNSPLNLSQCRFLESKLYALALKSRRCILTNKVAPQPAFLSLEQAKDTEDLLDKAIVIVSALGLDFFEPSNPTVNPPQLMSGEAQPSTPIEPPEVPAHLRQLLVELQKAATGPSLSKAEWYWTRVPDYRAKVVNGDDFRVFLRIRWNKKELHVEPKEMGSFKISDSADLDHLRAAIQLAYNKADGYLKYGK